jgi:hypothetical protein
VCARIAGELTVSSTAEYETHLDLVCNEPSLIVEYSGSSASLRMPYWYGSDQAASVMERAYRVAGIVAAETGLVALDSQTELTATAENLDAAIAIYSTMMVGVERIIKADKDNPIGS